MSANYSLGNATHDMILPPVSARNHRYSFRLERPYSNSCESSAGRRLFPTRRRSKKSKKFLHDLRYLPQTTRMCNPTASSPDMQTAREYALLQKNPLYPPDKENTWTHAKEDDGWMRAHNAIRAEIQLLISSLKPITKEGLSGIKVHCIQTAWKCHFDHVHAHHTNEDNLFVPFLATRFEYPDTQEMDHTELVDKLGQLSTMVAALAQGDTCEALYQGLTEYQAIMLPHLASEEEKSLPLMRAYFTPEEIAPMVQKIIAAGPIFEMGSFIACMGVEAFRSKFMVQEGIPDFVWVKDFKGRYELYQEQFARPLKLLSEAELNEF